MKRKEQHDATLSSSVKLFGNSLLVRDCVIINYLHSRILSAKLSLFRLIFQFGLQFSICQKYFS
jgi:hypothetical protein